MTPPPSDPAATVRNVTMRFREHAALSDVSTVIERDAITGHRFPTSGSIEASGAHPYENDAVLRRVCFIKEGQRYPDPFRVRDALGAAALACVRDETADRPTAPRRNPAIPPHSWPVVRTGSGGTGGRCS
jgi:hypothetical protein